MSDFLSKLKTIFFGTEKAPFKIVDPPNPYRLVITQDCLQGIIECLKPEIEQRHEGITYLFGQTNGNTTLAVGALRPEAKTTPGSFYVSPLAMSKVVRSVCNLRLQVVGQVHTHPGQAYHSEGDDEGARQAYPGYASLVIPDYGQHLPSLVGVASFMYHSHENGFVELKPTDTVITSGKLK